MSGPPKKWPSYGLPLFRRRATGFTPWLVVAAVGVSIDWETLRGDYGVGRIGFGPRFPFERGDYRCLFGLDVLVVMMGYDGIDEAAQAARNDRALSAIWLAGQPATLWTMQSGYAHRLSVIDSTRELYFTVGPDAHALDESFPGVVAQQRQVQLMTREGVFARPEFDEAHAALLRRLMGGPASNNASPRVPAAP